MKKDIYAKKPRKTSNKIIKYYPIANNRQKLDELENIKSQLDKVESIVKASTPLVKVQMPEVQEVEVNNFPEPKEVKFPEVQKVEVQNQPKIEVPDKVTVKNTDEIGKNIGKYLVFPKNIKAEVTNFEKPQVIPVGRGNMPGKADPEEYVPVRLTNGKKFYEAMGEQYVSAAKTVFPFVNKNTGKPQPATVGDDGVLQSNASVSVTTTSGVPLDVTVRNIPTVQTVAVQSMPNISVTTASGQPGLNFPTVQTVVVANPSSANVTTTSGNPLDVTVRNIPTIQKVSVADMPITTISGFISPTPGVTTAVSGTVTTVSGSKTDIQNFPTVQTVSVQNLPSITGSVTTISGSKTDVSNFPTVQTVSVQNIPSITGSVTTLSGSKTDISNFPTYQSVDVHTIPNITTASGSIIDIKNFPTVQSVREQNPITSITTLSGSATDIKNFPTIQKVSVQDIPFIQIQPGVTTAVSGSLSLTTTSGSPINDFITNLPTVQTVNMQLGGVNQSGANVVDTSNSAIKVNVVAGGTGGGVADTQVRDIAGAWHDVGHRDGTDVNMPIVIKGGASTISGSVTTISGSIVDIKNFPTVQSVREQNPITIITTLSGSATDVKNFPTVQTVNVMNMPTVVTTAISGTNHAVVDNFPTIQTVQTQGVTTISGQAGVTLAVSGTVTTVSGFHTTIDNFPTIQKVSIADLPNVTLDSNVTTASGSIVDIKNFPTYQSVLANTQYLNGTQIDTNSGNKSAGTQRMVIATDQPNLTIPLNVTMASGVGIDVKNFPTFSTVNVQNLPNLTSASGTNLHVYQDNNPTVQTVQSPIAGNMMSVSYDTTDTLYSGVVPNPIRYAPIIASSAGLTTVVSGIANKVIKVIEWGLLANSAVNIDWRNAGTVKQLTGLMYLAANTGFSSGYNPKGHFVTENGQGLAIELSGSVAVGGYLSYIASQ